MLLLLFARFSRKVTKKKAHLQISPKKNAVCCIFYCHSTLQIIPHSIKSRYKVGELRYNLRLSGAVVYSVQLFIRRWWAS